MELLLQHIALNRTDPRLPPHGAARTPSFTDRGALGVASVSMSGRSVRSIVLCFVRVFCRRDYRYLSLVALALLLVCMYKDVPRCRQCRIVPRHAFSTIDQMLGGLPLMRSAPCAPGLRMSICEETARRNFCVL